MRELLYPLSFVYKAGLEIDKRLTLKKELPKPVISVGNITWGGTGKTPLVIKTAKYCLALGLKPCVLTRGYKRKSGSSVLVSDAEEILVPPALCGDEPYLIAQSVKGAIVISASDRFSAAMTALNRFAPDVFILDDGFQHWSLKRDLDIVCINSQNPFGNGLLIPAGILREPVSSLRRAGIVVLTNTELSKENESVEKKLFDELGISALKSKYVPTGLTRLKDKKEFTVSVLDNKNVCALSAIGENAQFKKTLESSGFSVRRHFTFRDHHWYSQEELEVILSLLGKDSLLLTTSKDAVRISLILDSVESANAEKVYSFNVDPIFQSGEKIWENEIKKAARFS